MTSGKKAFLATYHNPLTTIFEMPILTNPMFEANNRQPVKRPLFVLWIEGMAEPLTTFRLEDAQVSRGGYGIGGYGINGYGS